MNDTDMAITMTLSFEDYKNSAHSVIPEEEFARYLDMAEKAIRRYIKTFTAENCSEDNKRCIYEIADILYSGNNQLNLWLSGFSNENYREQYFESENLSQNNKIWEVINLYFTHEQLYRGV